MRPRKSDILRFFFGVKDAEDSRGLYELAVARNRPARGVPLGRKNFFLLLNGVAP